MAYEREHRLDDRALESPADELERPEVETAVPGKYTRTQELDRIAAFRSPAAVGLSASPGRHPFSAPKLAFRDFRALALRDVLSRLDHRPALRDATLAAADPNVARRVAARTVVADRNRKPRNGEGMWRAAERRAVTLYRRALATGNVALETPAVTAALQAIGCGVPLDPRVRAKMERILGVRLDRVRLHTGSVAMDAASAANAEAFTVGEDIFLPAYNPESIDCQRLLLHELVHCCQWWQGRIAATSHGIAVSQPGDALEREAETVVSRAFHRQRGERADAIHPLQPGAERAPQNVASITRETLPPARSVVEAGRGSAQLSEFVSRERSGTIAPLIPRHAALRSQQWRRESGLPVAALHPATSSGSSPLRIMRQAKSGSEVSAGHHTVDASESDILQSLADLRRSVILTPAQWKEVGGEYVQFVADNWELICGVIACFFTVEWASKKFAASKNFRAAAIGQTFLLVFDLVALGLSLNDMKGHAETAWNLAWSAKGDERKIYNAGVEWARMAVSLVLACVAAGASLRNLLNALKLFRAARAARTGPTTRSFAEAPRAGDIEMTWNEERQIFETASAGSTRTSPGPVPAPQSSSLTAASTASSHAELQPVYVALGSAKGSKATPPDNERPAGLPKPDAPGARTPRNPHAIIRYPNGEVARVSALGELNSSAALRNPGNGLPGYTDVAIHGDPISVDAMRRAPVGGRTAAEARRTTVEGARAENGLPTIDGRSVRTDSGIEEWTPEHLADVLTRIGIVGEIRLISCNAGAYGDGFAARLAWELKTAVLANPEIVHIDQTSGVVTHSGWFRFEPVEGKGVRRTLSLQTWEDRRQFAYYARFVAPLQAAPYRIVLNHQTEAPAVRARSYAEDIRAISNMVGADLGLFVETHGQHHVILQRAPRTGARAPLIAPPGTRELYRVTAGEDLPTVSNRADRTIKQHLKAAESGRRGPPRSTASSNQPPALRSWSDVNAPASELHHLFKHYFDRSDVERQSARAELVANVRQLLLEVGLTESTWTVLSKVSDEKLRSLVEAEHFLPAIASFDRNLHSVVEWLAYAYASDRITVGDYHYHLAKAVHVAHLPVATLLSAEPRIDGSTLLFEAKRGSKTTLVRVPLGQGSHETSPPIPMMPSRTRVRIFDLNRRIWVEAHEVAANAVPIRREGKAPSPGNAADPSPMATVSASSRRHNLQDIQQKLAHCFRDYYVNPAGEAHGRLLARVRQLLTDEVGITDRLWEPLDRLHHSRLSSFVTSQEFLHAASNPKLTKYVELIAKSYAANHSNVPIAVWMFYLRQAEETSRLPEVTSLVPFDRGNGNRGTVFRGRLDDREVLVKIPSKIVAYDLTGDELHKINSLQRYEAGPSWIRRVRMLHPTEGIYRQAVATEVVDGYSVASLRDLMRQNKALPFRITPSYVDAMRTLQARLKADSAYLQDAHRGNVLLTQMKSRLVVLIDMMVLHGSKGLDGDVGDLSDVVADVRELEHYSRDQNNPPRPKHH